MRTVKALYYQCILKAFTYLGEIKEKKSKPLRFDKDYFT